MEIVVYPRDLRREPLIIHTAEQRQMGITKEQTRNLDLLSRALHPAL